MWPFTRSKPKPTPWPQYHVAEGMLPDGRMGWSLYRCDFDGEFVWRKMIALLPDRAEIERLRAEREAERDAHECRR